MLHRVGKALTTVPENFVVHKHVKKLLDARKKMLETEQGITWGFAEALAFGALLTKYSPSESLGIFTNSEGADVHQFDGWGENSLESEMVEHPTVSIRLSGQDVVRGTFNQRHSAIYDQDSGRPYIPLHHLQDAGFAEQADIDVCNSSLSEFAVLGFEYGFSLSNEMALTIFEVGPTVPLSLSLSLSMLLCACNGPYLTLFLSLYSPTTPLSFYPFSGLI